MDPRILSSSTGCNILIETIIIFRNSVDIICSCKRFYLIRDGLSIHSFYSKIRFDLRRVLLTDFYTVSFVFKGNLLNWSSFFQKSTSGRMRIYCLIFSDVIQYETMAIHDRVLEIPSLNNSIFDYITDAFPQVREFLDVHPEFETSLSSNDSNEILNQLVNNPSRIHDIMLRHDQELRNIESLPGGYSALERLYLDIQEPLQNVFEGMIPNEYGDNVQNLNSNEQSFLIAENRRPLGNPWVSSISRNQSLNQQPIRSNSQLVNLYSQMLSNRNIPILSYPSMQHRSFDNSRTQVQMGHQSHCNLQDVPNIDRLEEIYSIQLELFVNMGFTDRNKILHALFVSNGDIDLALSILLSH